MLLSLKSWPKIQLSHCKYIKFRFVTYQTSPKAVVLKKTVKNVSEKKKGRHSITVVQPLQEEITKDQTTVINENQTAWQEIKLDWRSLPKEYLKLSKFRLTSLVVMTSMAGYTMAPGIFDPITFGCCSIGTALLSSAANAINQYHEVPFDAQMARTRNRILVRGIITPMHALGFAAICSVGGLSILYNGTTGLTAVLGLSNLILYTTIYTPMKRISIVNTWVGSIVGALPPLMGWASCTGHLEAGAWILAGVLYAWQFPHFNALSWNLRPEYSRAGYRMMAVTDPGLCRRTALRYTFAITALSCSAPLVDLTNIWFAVESLPLNIYFSYLAWKFYKESDSSSSRKLFRFSLLHLPVLMLLMLVNKKNINNIDEEIKLESESRPAVLNLFLNSSNQKTTL